MTARAVIGMSADECRKLAELSPESACVIAQFGRAEQQRLPEYRRAVRAKFFNELLDDADHCADCIERARA